MKGVWRNEAGLECAILRSLPHPPVDKELKEVLKSKEFRWANPELHVEIKVAVDAARENARIRELILRPEEEEERDLKRRRLSQDLDARDVELGQQMLELKRQQLELEKASWAFECQKKGVVL